MVTPAEKMDPNKYCEFHADTGHSTDECMQLIKQIDEMIKSGKLSQFIKELKQNDKPKAPKKGETAGKYKPLAILMIQPWERVAKERVTQSFSPKTIISFPSLGEEDGTEGPRIIEAEIGGHFAPARNKKLDDPRYHITHRIQWRNYLADGPDIPTSKDRMGIRKIRAVPSTAHGMLKFLVKGGTVTIRSSRVIPMECSMISGPNTQHPVTNLVLEEKIKVAIHPEYPEQTIAIGSTLTEKGCKELCALLRQNLDVFALKPADMTGVPWHMAEHRLNVREGCPPVTQKKRGQAPERNKAIQEEVEKLDGYPLPEIDWKVESLCGYPFKCFLDAYKGYHQIKMAEEDEEKIAFITSQGIFCYTKMPFDLKNAGATYQRLVDNAFQKQIRLNAEGLKVCPDKADAVLSLPSSGCLKDVQKLNGKLASLNRFLLKSAEKSLLFFKTLKKCTKKGDFQWTQEAEVAFKQMKKLIAELPMLTAPKEKEELIMYLAATKEAISAVLMTERGGKQLPMYFVSRALRGPEINYTPMKNLILALLSASRRLKSGRMLNWKFELEGYDIQYRPRTSIKGQILVDFIVERLDEESPDELMAEPEE
ncbi:reverse transcriptase domain-containing protein [Tanacetum coccineum]